MYWEGCTGLALAIISPSEVEDVLIMLPVPVATELEGTGALLVSSLGPTPVAQVNYTYFAFALKYLENGKYCS